MADATSSFPTCQVPLTVLAWRHAGFPTDTYGHNRDIGRFDIRHLR